MVRVGWAAPALALAMALGGCGATPPATSLEAFAVAAPAAAPAPRQAGDSRDDGKRLVGLFAEGRVEPSWVLPSIVPALPPWLEFRARYAWPAADDEEALDLQVFVTGVEAPIGLPLPPESVISHLRARVERVRVSRTPEPNLMITGVVTATPTPSPFGPLVGRLVTVAAGFTYGDTATFQQIGGPVAGSHSTLLPVATGSLRFARDD
jgi:hypothetical protein